MSPGHDAVLHCKSPVAKVYFQLLREGDEKPFLQRWSDQPSTDFKLSYVGPQHAGMYSCKYKPRGPSPVLSEPSDPVELKVAGEASMGPVGWTPCHSFCPHCAHSLELKHTG